MKKPNNTTYRYVAIGVLLALILFSVVQMWIVFEGKVAFYPLILLNSNSGSIPISQTRGALTPGPLLIAFVGIGAILGLACSKLRSR